MACSLSTTTSTTTLDPPREPAADAGGEAAPAAAPARLASVDALRGVVMFAMLFVNDVAGVRGAPAWMKHYAADANGMTLADWVFGGFLFIVGVSIPLAFQRRLARGNAPGRLILHVLTRTAGLLLLGVFMVNGAADPQPAGWPKHLWEMLVYLFAILAFLAPPGRTRKARTAGIAMRLLGFAGFALLALVFRDGEGRWMRTSWWGILGLIGWAYLVASLLYLLLRGHRNGMIAAVALLIGLYLADRRGLFGAIPLDRYVDIGSMLGSHAAITMAGAVLGSVLLLPQGVTRHISFAIALGVSLLFGAALMYPLHGINKNAATPAWCLICAAATAWLWAGLSILIDRLRVVRPMALFIRSGENVLLAYLLMPLFLQFIWMTGLTFYGRIGELSPTMGVTRAAAAAIVVLWLAAVLKDRGVRLKL